MEVFSTTLIYLFSLLLKERKLELNETDIRGKEKRCELRDSEKKLADYDSRKLKCFEPFFFLFI